MDCSNCDKTRNTGDCDSSTEKDNAFKDYREKIEGEDIEDADSFHSADETEDEEFSEANDDKQRQFEESLSDVERTERCEKAKSLKEEGNDSFKSSDYSTAITLYTSALQMCPIAQEQSRAVLFSNRAACYAKLEQYDRAIKDCNKAIDNNPQYLKALLRRADLYEKTEKLDEALKDYQKVVEFDPSHTQARTACMRLPQEINERNEKMKTEMLGKLKDLGNMILKPFGLSTNNFQMTQDPNSGGYSIKFNQNGH